MKFATVKGALSCSSSQWMSPMLVRIVATSGPLPGMSTRYSARSPSPGGTTPSVAPLATVPWGIPF